MYAFWKYHDRFPSYLGGEVDGDILKDGRVRVKGFEGYTFDPVRLLPNEQGKKLMSELRKLEESYNNDTLKLKEDYIDKLKKLAPELDNR